MNGAQVSVVYGAWDQYRVIDCVTAGDPGSRVMEYPHFDVLSVCPPAGAANYAFFY
jgi:hypothetical protein